MPDAEAAAPKPPSVAESAPVMPPPSAPPQGYAGYPGYPPTPYPPHLYPGFYPPPYPYPPQPGAAPPPDWAGPQSHVGPPPYRYPYPPMPYPPPYPAAYYAPPQTAYPPLAPSAPPLTSAEKTVQAQNQQVLMTGIIAAVLLIHLPWVLYLVGVHGCWGSFLEACRAVDPAGLDLETTSDTPMLFARVAFFMLRVQSVLSVDFAKFSEVLQLSTGLGSFALTKIVAANGMVATGNLRRFALAGTCAVAFVVLFWAELHLTGSTTYAILGDETVLSFIDLELPPDFLAATEAKAGLMQYLQILRLADALIFGAALAMPRAPKGV